MSGPAQAVTLRQARSRLRKKMPALEQMAAELTGLLQGLPMPSSAEVDAMERGEQPVTREAHLAAAVHLIAFYIEEAWTDTEAYFEDSVYYARHQSMPAHMFQNLRWAVKNRAFVERDENRNR